MGRKSGQGGPVGSPVSFPTFDSVDEYDLTLNKFNVPSAPKATSESIPCSAQGAVGRDIHVLFDIENDRGRVVARFFRGTIRNYRPSSGKHTVSYCDGETTIDDLTKEVVVWAPGMVTAAGSTWGDGQGQDEGAKGCTRGLARRAGGQRPPAVAEPLRGRRRQLSEGGEATTGSDSGAGEDLLDSKRRRRGSAGVEQRRSSRSRSRGAGQASILGEEGAMTVGEGGPEPIGEAADAGVVPEAVVQAATKDMEVEVAADAAAVADEPAEKGEDMAPLEPEEAGGVPSPAADDIAAVPSPAALPEPPSAVEPGTRGAEGQGEPVQWQRPVAEGVQEAVPTATVEMEVAPAAVASSSGVAAAVQEQAAALPAREAAAESQGAVGLRAAQHKLDSCLQRFFHSLDTTIKTVEEMQGLLEEVAAAAPDAQTLSAAGGLAKTVNRCAKSAARLFGVKGTGTVDKLHDSTLDLALLSRGLVNGWRVRAGSVPLPDDEALLARQPLRRYLDAPWSPRRPLPAGRSAPTAPAALEEPKETSGRGPKPSGDGMRDDALAILAHALAPAQSPQGAASGLEQQLYLDHREADGRVGDGYLRALRALWDLLSCRSEVCRPLLRHALLQGALTPSALVRASAEELAAAQEEAAASLLQGTATHADQEDLVAPALMPKKERHTPVPVHAVVDVTRDAAGAMLCVADPMDIGD